MSLRIAFTGTGHISRIHAQAAQAQDDMELVAVVNHRPESRAEYAAKFGIRRQYDDVTNLLEDGDVDALVVSTPNYLHAPQSIAALNAGVHVMVEKPMSMNVAEAQQMLAASQASGAKLMVAHCWRFDEEVQWLKRHIRRAADLARSCAPGVMRRTCQLGTEQLVRRGAICRWRRPGGYGHPRN